MKYKVIIGVKRSFTDKSPDPPEYFDNLDNAKEYIEKRKQEIIKDNNQVWFVKVWEFGKEDYIDMDLEI